MAAVTIQAEKEQPTEGEPLCEPCQTVSFEILRRAQGSRDRPEIASNLTYRELKYSALEGCPLCELFVDEFMYIGRRMAVNMGSSVEPVER
jgi:hypothetical protein